MPQQKKAEVSCSTSKCPSEEQTTSKHMQGHMEKDVRCDSRLSSSTLSSQSCDSSSSSSSSSVLTQAGKGCIHTIGEVSSSRVSGSIGLCSLKLVVSIISSIAHAFPKYLGTKVLFSVFRH